MEIVRLKDKGQVTIPAALREELKAQVGDFFAMTLEDDALVMRRQSLAAPAPQREPPKKKPSSWFGSVKGVYSSVEEIDAFIKSERAQWD
jgi:bifunctional DNA-binding transcriptional regulator/antitoxin component of YhaV-PrlF toxin-antitoxin module